MAPRRVADDLATPDEPEDDVLDPRAVVQAAGDDNDQPDEADSEADEEQPEDDGVNAADAQDEPAPRRRARADDDDFDARLTAAEERAAAAERRAVEAEARYSAQQQTPSREAPEQEAARLALMTPEQLVDYKVEKALGNHARNTQQMVLSASNTADKAAFSTLIRDNPAWRKIAPEVERVHTAQVAMGQYPTRETVLKYVLGEQAFKMASKTEREAGERQRRVDRQRVRPPAGNRSDVQPQRRGGKTLEERLDGVQL